MSGTGWVPPAASREKHRERSKASYRDKVAAGLCVYGGCMGAAEGGTRRCRVHGQVMRDLQKARWRAKGEVIKASRRAKYAALKEMSR